MSTKSKLINNNQKLNSTNKNFIIDTSAGTDATTFKNTMKGVLLAYEK